MSNIHDGQGSHGGAQYCYNNKSNFMQQDRYGYNQPQDYSVYNPNLREEFQQDCFLPNFNPQMMDNQEMMRKINPGMPQEGFNMAHMEGQGMKEGAKQMNGYPVQQYQYYPPQGFDNRGMPTQPPDIQRQIQNAQNYQVQGYPTKTQQYRENPNPELAAQEDSMNKSYNNQQSVPKSYEGHSPGPQAVYDEHVLTKQEYIAQKRGKYNKTDFPNKPPRIFYYNGAEYYFNTYTGKDKQFMNYRCRDYNCNGSLKFHLKDSRMSPKILKDHYEH